MQILDSYIHELTEKQFYGYYFHDNDYFDVYISNTDKELSFKPNKDSPLFFGIPKMSVKVGRITAVKDLKTYEGTELQRKCREEIQTILSTLAEMGVIQ